LSLIHGLSRSIDRASEGRCDNEPFLEVSILSRIVATIEARMASSRLPGKVMAEASGKPMLELMIERLRFVPELEEIVVATTTNRSDDVVAELAARIGAGCWRGSEDDVLARVLDAAQAHAADIIVELTGDCPLVDPAIVSRVIGHHRQSGADYVSNCLQQTYPLGMETQVFSTSVLADAARRTDDPEDREHVSLFIYRHPEIFSIADVKAPPAECRPELRLTLDTKEDLAVIRSVFDAFSARPRNFSLAEIVDYLDTHPEIAAMNAAVEQRHV
jgi:spore coat polysaccharide biosynthesis protein SpsF